MVHVVDGEVRPGHFPRNSDAYERRRAAYGIESFPGERKAVPDNRFHLIVSAACPWAHRTLLLRELKDLRKISVSVVSPLLNDEVGWRFANQEDVDRYKDSSVAPTQDNASGEKFTYLYELYLKNDSSYTGNVTTPVLYDSVDHKIISNESWDIIRYLDQAFDAGPKAKISYELYPKSQQEAIDAECKWIQDVYKCGLAKSQKAYEEALDGVFRCLDRLEIQLSAHRYLVEQNLKLTLADIQLLPSLLRFDDVYHILFKCAKRRLVSYRHLSDYARDLYQIEGVKETTDFQQNKDHYFTHFTSANPNQVIPLGSSAKTFKRPHDRDRFRSKVEETVDRSKAGEQTNKEARQAKGEFVRGVSGHRRIITDTGEGKGELPAEKDRYHLYIANNCPWCHRVMLARAILGLEDIISVDVLFYRRDPERGWQFLPEESELRDIEIKHRHELLDGKVSTIDSINGKKYAPEIYQMYDSKERSVPILFDRKENQIVNNESAEIVRMFSQGFRKFHRAGAPDLYPESLATEIDALNNWIYPDINNGAYRAGFSSDQATYEDAFRKYFAAFDRLETILAHSRFLTGDTPTEADVRLFPTIFRHDPVYYARMKVNDRMVLDCPHLSRWLQDMIELPGVKEASNLDHAIFGYFGRTGNGLIPPRPNPRWY
mmetsp:Transcript_11649/g.22935  ORF Transcript_11649/g.22935 Transcript_11649/m.22935 type:complete len:659 (-) Transcript_11649:97-2073(-)|eukprot:CAMPEP_0171573670 /NCGR_PEP_ID=MMETSP0961-20121227/4896_1 /TAXON_ID=87120 /ORGANISM="Aurantiochytrium limacinum, Strain ATCCMYA-1381" /LENGTH=658 /DNA_ID=CAMNT_0012128831 /DNA_START=109 /DNA_END=2085 /DNA_ORIENTATION=+